MSAEWRTLWDVRDGSALFTPAASWSASSAVTVRGGLFFSAGSKGTLLAPGSEFGIVPTFGYVSVAAFF